MKALNQHRNFTILSSLCPLCLCGAILLICCQTAFAIPAPPWDAVTPISTTPLQWQPLYEEALPEMLGTDKPYYRMPCNLAATDKDRCAWDAPLSLDLATARGFDFWFYADSVAPVSYFTFYFNSGDGWYSTAFAPERLGAWCRIRIDKAQMKPEGSPKGWHSIQTMRIAAWKGLAEDTAFYVGGFSTWSLPEAKVAVLLGDTSAESNPGEARTISDTAERVIMMLDDLGVQALPLGDRSLTPALLKGKTTLVLPYTPTVSDGALNTITDFVKNGGKLVLFYKCPKNLLPLTGLTLKGYYKNEPEGLFTTIQRANPEGYFPAAALQHSWNIQEYRPLDNRGRVAAWWHNAAGERTDHAAVVITGTTAYMSHILLQEDPENKQQLLLAMLGAMDPGIWEQAVTYQLDHAGAFAAFKDTSAALETMLTQDVQGRATESLRAARDHWNLVQQKRKDKQYPEALTQSQNLHTQLIRAWCTLQPPPPEELRGFWCHDPKGVDGMSWDDAVRILSENGFTALFPNMLWGGVAYYPSEVLPVDKVVQEKGDQIAEALAACEKYGVDCHVWKVCWNMAYYTPADFKARMKLEGRTQVDKRGKAKDDWLCPSEPRNQDLEVNAMLEIAKKYPVQGVHFDYIRFPDNTLCYCPGCRKRFEAHIGKSVAAWPKDVLRKDAVGDAWLQFRRDQITSVVQRVYEGAKAIRPDIQISAAVFKNAPTVRDSIGQDWSLWCEKGYLDFVCPMDYTEHAVELDTLIQQQQQYAKGVPCYPGIGLSLWNGNNRIVRLAEQINLTRKHTTGGFLVFNYGASEAGEILPLCGLGITKKQDQ